MSAQTDAEIGEIIEDIKSINRLLDPAGAAWAAKEKAEREARNRSVHPVLRGFINGIGRGYER